METITLPSGREAEIKAISAKEDLILRDQKLLRKGKAIDQVLEACVVRLDGKEECTSENLLDMSSLDRSVLMLELRKISYGSEMSIDHVCLGQDCDAAMPLTFDLDELEVTPPKTDQEQAIDLPSGAKAVIIPPVGHMERELVKLKNATDHDFLLKCLKELNGEPPSRAAFLKLSARDLMTLRKTVKETYGFIDDVAVVRCEECGMVNRLSLMTHPGFLFPEM